MSVNEALETLTKSLALTVSCVQSKGEAVIPWQTRLMNGHTSRCFCFYSLGRAIFHLTITRHIPKRAKGIFLGRLMVEGDANAFRVILARPGVGYGETV